MSGGAGKFSLPAGQLAVDGSSAGRMGAWGQPVTQLAIAKDMHASDSIAQMAGSKPKGSEEDKGRRNYVHGG